MPPAAPPLAVLLAASLALPLGAQQKTVGADASARHASLGKTSVTAFLAQAQRDGRIRCAEDRVAAKHAFRASAERPPASGSGRRGNAFNSQPTPPNGLAGAPRPLAILAETECNDSPGWADDVTGQGGGTGTLSRNDDRDFFRLVLSSDAILTASVAAGAAPPQVDDPDLEIFDGTACSVAYNDDAVGYYPALALVLPAGTYYLAVGCPFALVPGSYALTTSIVPTTIPTIRPSTAQTGSLNGAANPTYRLLLASDSRISATVTGPSNWDMYMDLRGDAGHVIRRCDDSTAGILNPGLNTNLPAGAYFVTFGEYGNLAGTFGYRFDVTPAPMPALACPGQVSGTISGDEDFVLYRCGLGASQRLTLVTSGNNVPMTDTVLHLFDARLRPIAYNNEGSPSTSLSLLDTPLPSGTYYVANRGFAGDFGGYALSSSCGPLANVAPVAWGKTAGAVTAFQGQAYSFTVGTANPLEVRTDTSSGTLVDPQVAIVDANGLCHGYSDDAFATLESATGSHLQPGAYWVLVRDWNNVGGTFDLHLAPPLAFADALNNRTLVSLAKAGTTNYALVGLAALPAPVPLPYPFVGSLLLDLTVYVQLGPLLAPSAGTFSWAPSLQPYAGVVAQAISIAHAPLSGSISDLVR